MAIHVANKPADVGTVVNCLGKYIVCPQDHLVTQAVYHLCCRVILNQPMSVATNKTRQTTLTGRGNLATQPQWGQDPPAITHTEPTQVCTP